MREPIAKKKTYEKPSIKELTLEQAKLTLLGEVTLGNQEAHGLLKVIFPGQPSKEMKKGVGKGQ
jgi:hypothetical protein